jgi:hypothetical protein
MTQQEPQFPALDPSQAGQEISTIGNGHLRLSPEDRDRAALTGQSAQTSIGTHQEVWEAKYLSEKALYEAAIAELQDLRQQAGETEEKIRQAEGWYDKFVGDKAQHVQFWGETKARYDALKIRLGEERGAASQVWRSKHREDIARDKQQADALRESLNSIFNPNAAVAEEGTAQLSAGDPAEKPGTDVEVPDVYSTALLAQTSSTFDRMTPDEKAILDLAFNTELEVDNAYQQLVETKNAVDILDQRISQAKNFHLTHERKLQDIITRIGEVQMPDVDPKRRARLQQWINSTTERLTALLRTTTKRAVGTAALTSGKGNQTTAIQDSKTKKITANGEAN